MKRRKITVLFMIILLTAVYCGCSSEEQFKENKEEVVNLIWYQVGEPQEDMALVLEKVSEYTKEKIGVTVEINQIGWKDYNKTMQTIINTGQAYDLAFTSSWTNDYVTNAQRGAFLQLDDLLTQYGKEMYGSIDENFWEAVKIDGKIYGVPSEKEIGSMPMWVFTKEYVDKYNVPYQDIHTLEDLEPWLKIIQENEPDVVPLYITNDYSVPRYMEVIQDIIGIEYGDATLTVKNLYETDRMIQMLKVMRRYYLLGYINNDAALTTDNKSVKRFVTKGDGQPYAESIWSKDLGYEVVASNIMDAKITNVSARGAITAISKTSKYPEKAVMLLNLINTDEYLRNLLNYGIEGVHYEKVELSEEDKELAEGKEDVYDFKIRLNPDKQRSYSVPYWVQGGLFNTYVLETEPIDKWSQFSGFNAGMKPSLCFGFDFESKSVYAKILKVKEICDKYAAPLNSGSVDPEVYIPQMNQKLDSVGIDAIIDEMQRQIDQWKANQE